MMTTTEDNVWVRFSSGLESAEEEKESNLRKGNFASSSAHIYEYILTRRIGFIQPDTNNSTGEFLKPDARSITRKLDNSEIYHLKMIKDFFSCCGEGKEEQSLIRLLDITSKLTKRSSFCLPVAVRLKKDNGEESKKCDAIVFEKLAGFNIGLPKDSMDRKHLVKKIESVVEEMHKLGVVHMDLYLSNIMWKKNDDDDGSFNVRIIDFDAAHRIGEKLTDTAWNALNYGNVPDFCLLGNKATKEHDTLYIDMIKTNIDDMQLQDNVDPNENECDVKERLDSRCSELMADHFYTLAHT